MRLRVTRSNRRAWESTTAPVGTKPQFQADCLGLRLVLLPEPVQYRRDREA